MQLSLAPRHADSARSAVPPFAFERLMTLVTDLVLATRRDGTILLANAAWQDCLGWTREELVGRSVTEFIHPDDLHSSSTAASATELVSELTNRYRHKDGSWRWLTWSARPDGDIWYAVAKDVTELAEEAAAAAQLHSALLTDELKVLYQPVVSVADRAVTGCEALLRWQHPQHGWLLPDRFVPLAEETGLIVPVGEHVLTEATRQAGQWRKAGRELTVSVNVSRRQLLEPRFVELVRRALRRGGVPGTAICLEVTETVAPAQHGRIIEVLHEVRRLGCTIALDDFGAGYSTLANLRELPIDVIKVDKSFVAGIAANADDRGIVAAVMALARELRLSVVAEGVEQERQLAVLRALGCPFAQGHLFSVAVAGAEI